MQLFRQYLAKNNLWLIRKIDKLAIKFEKDKPSYDELSMCIKVFMQKFNFKEWTIEVELFKLIEKDLYELFFNSITTNLVIKPLDLNSIWLKKTLKI